MSGLISFFVSAWMVLGLPILFVWLLVRFANSSRPKTRMSAEEWAATLGNYGENKVKFKKNVNLTKFV